MRYRWKLLILLLLIAIAPITTTRRTSRTGEREEVGLVMMISFRFTNERTH